MYGLKKVAVIGMCEVSSLILAYYLGKKVESMAIENLKKQMEESYYE